MALDFQPKLKEYYDVYNNVIKMLIADYESREERFPEPIFNEIRAFNDHVSQCYRDGISDEDIRKELHKAERHIYRIVLDCYKYLDVSLNDKVKKFARQTFFVDLTLINNGEFYSKYRALKNEARIAVRDAKKMESKDNDEAVNLYQGAYQKYCELEEFIESNSSGIRWVAFRSFGKKILKFIGWWVSAILAGLLALFISCDWLHQFIISLFQHK